MNGSLLAAALGVVSAVATNILAALTALPGGGLTIALDALGLRLLLAGRRARHRSGIAASRRRDRSGTLDSLPHNGAVVTLLAVCGSHHRESYFDIVMVAIVGAIVALAAVILLGSFFGSF